MNVFSQASDFFSRFSADYSKHGVRALARYFGSLALLVGLVVVTVRLLFGGTTTCLGETLQLQLSARAPSKEFADQCTLETFRLTLIRDIALTAVYMLGMGVFVAVWWAESWDTERERSTKLGTAFTGAGLVALALTAVANTITRARIDITAADHELKTTTTLISALSWVRWLLTGLLVVGLLTTVIAWLIRLVAHLFRALFDQAQEKDYVPVQITWPPDGGPETRFGVCLSGGGLRAAAFGLGALSALEETPVDQPHPNSSAGLLGQADVLASVSGGGYAASAWRIAVGPEPGPNSTAPILGNPNECDTTHRRGRFSLTSEADRPTPLLFPRLLAHRGFLAGGRGGLPVALAWVFVQLIWHLGILLATVGLVAWPAGRMIRSPIITSPDGAIPYGRLSTPGLLVLAVVGLVLVVRSLTREGTARTVCNYAVTALSALALGLLTLLVAIPWLVAVVIPRLGRSLPGGSGATSTVFIVLAAGVVATIWRVIQAPLRTYAAYLGGVLLAVGLILFGGVISLHARSDDRFFSGSWTSWFIAVGIFLGIMSVVNPDLWSLHPVYRRKLASTFANRFTDDGWLNLGAKEAHLPLSAYIGAPGPKQVICAVAARTDRANTGVPVVSMTFEPDHVTLHPGPGQPSVAIETASYEKIFAGRVRARWLRSVVGLAAMSGAALAPSLGRMSMGSTNALIAALNLRLGVWMPNPMYARGRRPGTNLYSMFKEMLGMYDLSDPNIYITDGGHWENLGLVELIRRKTRIIIAVDASADPPHTFASLLEAVELALLECNAVIAFPADELEAIRPAGSPRPTKNWAAAAITYNDGSAGRLLYVKAQASQAMPLDVLRYSKEDPDFPNYSTAQLFPSEAEFVNLAILGRESIIKALNDKSNWLFGPRAQTTTAEAEADTTAAEAAPTEMVAVEVAPPEMVVLEAAPAETVVLEAAPAEMVAVEVAAAEVIATEAAPAAMAADQVEDVHLEAEPVAVDGDEAPMAAGARVPMESAAAEPTAHRADEDDDDAMAAPADGDQPPTPPVHSDQPSTPPTADGESAVPASSYEPDFKVKAPPPSRATPSAPDLNTATPATTSFGGLE
ncbi:MAG: hypothetical protein OER95_06510 [Acidimicrobiia bacterium]|nr:hypothetical protein [Acidimicrobiia bacterium]